MSSNEPNTSRNQDSEDRPQKIGIEDSDAVETKKVRGPDEPSFSQVALYNPAFNPFISMFNPWLNPFLQPFGLFQMMAALQAGIQGFGALGGQEVDVKPEEADVSEDQRKVVLGSQEVEVEEADPSKDLQALEVQQARSQGVKIEVQHFTSTQIQGLQWAYNINSSPIAEQMILLADKLQLSHETVKKYFEDRRKQMEDLVKMEAPQDQPLTQESVILTRNLASRIAHLISEHHTTQEVFGKRVIGKSKGMVSDLINNPRPYEILRSPGKRVWERILAWVKLCEKDRKAVLDGKPTDCCPFEAPGDSPSPSRRTIFTPEQIEGLRKAYADNRSLNYMRRARLADELQLRPDTVNNWFQGEKKRVRNKNNENTFIH